MGGLPVAITNHKAPSDSCLDTVEARVNGQPTVISQFLLDVDVTYSGESGDVRSERFCGSTTRGTMWPLPMIVPL